MNLNQKEYHIGIDYGTSNSVVGIFMKGTVHIAPNHIGERITPSVVSFTLQNNELQALVGEETISQKMDDFKNTIYEVKRFIGLSYEEFIDRGFDKNLNYEIVNMNGIPKIHININGVEQYYSAIDISAYILKKMIQNAEEFIAQKNQGVKIKKAVITVPAHFRDHQKEAVKLAAEMAGIEIARIINEPTAAALAFGLGKDLKNCNEDDENDSNPFSIFNPNFPGDSNSAPSPIQKLKQDEKKEWKENAMVFDLGGGTLDVTILNIHKNNVGDINFDVKVTDGDIHLGGSDFDNKLIDYCINEFCKSTGNKEEYIRADKKACKRLKIKCEHSKKLLSIMNETIINIDNFYGQNDLMIPMKRQKFEEELCKDLYDRIEQIIHSSLEEAALTIEQIDKVILVGGATKMSGIKVCLGRIFKDPKKIKSNINPDEAVAYGATLNSAKIEEKDKINFNLQDVVAYKLGVESKNPDPKDQNGCVVTQMIKRYEKIPCSNEKSFKTIINQNTPDIVVNVYEGNNLYTKDNKLLGTISLNDIGIVGEICYKVKFNVDVNSKLTIGIKVDSSGRHIEKEIKDNIVHGLADKSTKKIKILKTKELTPMASINTIFNSSILKFQEAKTPEEKIKFLNKCIKVQEDRVNNYVCFLVDNEAAYEYVYTSTKELFDLYIDILKFKGNEKVNVPEIMKKIGEFLGNFISAIGYMEELLNTLKVLKNCGLNNEFFEIFVNFMKLLNDEALKKKTNENQNYKRYYCKLYFERVFHDTRKYIEDSDINQMNIEIKEKFLKQKKICEDEMKKINSFTEFIEKKLKEGKFIFGQNGQHSGFTIIGKKIENFEENMDDLTIEQIQEVLDLYENMVGSFDKAKFSMGELYCLGNIIFINSTFFKRGYNKLWKDIKRFETILENNKDAKADWIDSIKDIIQSLKENQN